MLFEMDSAGLDKLRRECRPIQNLLDDPRVIEIMLNADGCVWAEWLGQDPVDVGRMDLLKAKSLVGTVASLAGTVINHDKPRLSCEFPLDNSRFEAMFPPVSTAPIFSIRKHLIETLSLEDYVQQGVMTKRQKEAIQRATSGTNGYDKKNIVIAGSTGSGKTTLANAIIRYISEAHPLERLLILEDTREIQCNSRNYIALKAIDGLIDTSGLLSSTLRFRPDRILVGEVREAAPTLAMLKAWNTGHPGGLVTVHANSAVHALTRIETLISEVSMSPQKDLIADAVGLVIFIARIDGMRIVKEVAEVKGHMNGHYMIEEIGE